MNKNFINRNSINKILIIKPSAFGDIVHTLPFLNALKRGYPDAKIDWVVADGLHKFLEGHSMINKLWVIKKDKWKKLNYLKNTFKEIAALTKGLRSEKYDVAVDLSGILRSGLIALASGAKIKLGFKESDEGSPFFYSHKIEGDMTIHAIDRYLKFAEALGCPIDAVAYPFAPFDEKPKIMQELPSEYVIISPSAGKQANQWHASRFGELASMLPLPSVVISGLSPQDMSTADEVVKYSNGKAISIAGKTGLKDLIPVIGRAKYFITNDTGPMHVAAALNVPVFAIFGPANPVRTGPYDSIKKEKSNIKTETSKVVLMEVSHLNRESETISIHTIIQKPLNCSPCYAQKPCSHWSCMNDLTVQDVLEAILGKK
ncbi:MAG: glycosyltransferase family 9 protein [Desulfamplus sp.]|nr:glycosyltransferase family 9 protein [Desulfamplus sp.]